MPQYSRMWRKLVLNALTKTVGTLVTKKLTFLKLTFVVVDK